MHKKGIRTEAAWSYFSEKDVVGKAQDRDVILVANNLNTPENIGGLIRVAGNVGCSKVIFTGDQDSFKSAKIKRAATNGYDKVDWTFCKEEEWPALIPDGYTIIAIETVEGATDIYTTALPDKIVFVVGNESFGMTDWSLEQCNSSVYIPMPGIVKSLNVNQAGAVALFEWWRRVYFSE